MVNSLMVDFEEEEKEEEKKERRIVRNLQYLENFLMVQLHFQINQQKYKQLKNRMLFKVLKKFIYMN